MEQTHAYSAHSGTSAVGVGWRSLLLAVLGAFLLGGGAMFYFSGQAEEAGAGFFNLRDDAAPEATSPLGTVVETNTPITLEEEPAEEIVAEARQAVEQVEKVAEQTGGIDQRVAALEQRLTRLDIQSQAAAGNAARAEGMLIAFAARRSLERGQPLGILEDQLQLRFGDGRPNAVQTIVNASQNPVTLEQLLVRLEGIAPELTDIPADESVMTRLAHEISQLFSVRTDDTPSPVAERRLERAKAALEGGRIEAAIAEIRAMPNAEMGEAWLADAERYRAAQAALEALETAAVLDNSELRDSDGVLVETPSIAN